MCEYSLFATPTLLSSIGINNVGSIVQALLAKGSPGYDDAESSKWQVRVYYVWLCPANSEIPVCTSFYDKCDELPRSYFYR